MAAERRELSRTDPGYISIFVVVALCIGVTIVATFGEFAVGVLGPALERDLGADPAQLGILMALMFACSALAAVPSGILTDRIDPRKLLFIQVTLAALAFGTFAIMLQAGQLFLTVALIGAVMSLNGPMTNRIVIDFVPLKHRGSAVAWKSVGLQMSALLVGLTYGLTEPFSHWRTTTIAATVIMLIFGAWAHLRFRSALPLNGRPVLTVTAPIPIPGAPMGADTGSIKTAAARVDELAAERMAKPIVWWLIPYSLLTLGSFTAVGTYMVLFATTDVGVSAGTAANASGIAAGLSILARFIWVRWLTERNEVLMLTLAALSSAVSVVLLAVSPQFGPIGFWVAAMLIGLTILASTPVQQVVLIRNTNPRYIGRVSSIIGVSTSTSLAGMPFVMSQVIGTLGIQATWYVVAGVTVLGAATMGLFVIVRRARAASEAVEARA